VVAFVKISYVSLIFFLLSEKSLFAEFGGTQRRKSCINIGTNIHQQVNVLNQHCCVMILVLRFYFLYACLSVFRFTVVTAQLK